MTNLQQFFQTTQKVPIRILLLFLLLSRKILVFVLQIKTASITVSVAVISLASTLAFVSTVQSSWKILVITILSVCLAVARKTNAPTFFCATKHAKPIKIVLHQRLLPPSPIEVIKHHPLICLILVVLTASARLRSYVMGTKLWVTLAP